MAIPHQIDTDDFRAAWCEWQAYRRERRQALTPSTAAMQLAELAKYGPAEAAAMVRQSIRNGWQGVFPLKREGGANGRGNGKYHPAPAADVSAYAAVGRRYE